MMISMIKSISSSSINDHTPHRSTIITAITTTITTPFTSIFKSTATAASRRGRITSFLAHLHVEVHPDPEEKGQSRRELVHIQPCMKNGRLQTQHVPS
jgi:hypothetical protein